jgi:hypothetical protein
VAPPECAGHHAAAAAQLLSLRTCAGVPVVHLSRGKQTTQQNDRPNASGDSLRL